MSKARVIGIVALAALAATAMAAEPAAEDRAARKAEHLTMLIEMVKTADHPSSAMAAYARGCGIDRTNFDLQNAYMRKMLSFGLPKISFYAARVLVRSQPDNGMAWGVVGYMHGRRGETAKALAASIRAAAGAPGDPSILHNVGQLLAWYDSEPAPPKLSDAARRILVRIRPQLLKQAAFAKAYEQTKIAYASRAALTEELSQRLSGAAEQAEDVRGQAQALDIQLRAANDEIGYRNRVIKSLRRELNRYYYYTYPVRTSDGVEYVYVPSYRGGNRSEIYERIRAERRAIEELELKVLDLRRQGRIVLADLARKRKALDAIQAEIRGALANVEQDFRWDPPAVDGKVTDEIEHFPHRRGKAPALPQDPSVVAEQKLALARLYVTNGMPAKAGEILKDLIAKYGSTEAATRAKIMLATLKPVK